MFNKNCLCYYNFFNLTFAHIRIKLSCIVLKIYCVTEEELKLKKKRQMKISDMFTKKTIEICVKCKLYIY